MIGAASVQPPGHTWLPFDFVGGCVLKNQVVINQVKNPILGQEALILIENRLKIGLNGLILLQNMAIF
jgi:hypothetical protein